METYPTNQRTTQGALLRAGLDELRRQYPTIPPGKKGTVAVAAVHEDGKTETEVGFAYLTARGWEVDAAIGATIREGKVVRIAGTGQLSW